MAESKHTHTPGPWKVGGSQNDWMAEPDEFEGGSAAWQPVSAEGRDDPVCLVVQQGGFRFDDGELDANASLIAAAPDMHEALYQCVGALKALGAEHGFAAEAARAALQKAEARNG